MIDTLKYSKRLEEVGFNSNQAEESIRILNEIMDNNIATKLDLINLERRMEKRFYQLEYNIGMQFKDQDIKIDKIDARFDKVDARFDKMDSRFDKMDSRFDKMDSRIDQMDSRFDKMDSRFDKIDSRFDKMDEKFSNFYEEIESKLVNKVGKMLFIATGLIIAILGALIKTWGFRLVSNFQGNFFSIENLIWCLMLKSLNSKMKFLNNTSNYS